MKTKKLIIWPSLVLGIILSGTSCEKSQNEEAQITDSIPSDSSLSVEDKYSISSGNLSMEVDPAKGARIVSFQVDGQEVLVQKSESEIYGSTFWTAPQSAWGWPPIAEIDEAPYKSIAPNVFESDLADTLGVVITKKFVGNADTSITITYTIENRKDTMVKIAPWEITRVASGGTTVFMTENATFKGKKPFGELEIISNKGISIFTYDSSKVSDNKKSFAYSSDNWIAQHKGEQLLVKVFENIKPSDCAPDESEIEIYANPNKKYIEIEQQGAYREIKGQEKYEWQVKWYLRKIKNQKYSADDYKKLVQSIIK